MSPKTHLLEIRWAYGKAKRRTACTTMEQPRMTTDVTKVTCSLCKATKFYEKRKLL